MGNVINYLKSGGGTDISDTTAVASDVLAGKDFYSANGVKTTGTIETYSGVTNVTDNGTLETAGKYLDSDLVVNVGGGIRISLPDNFLTATKIYYFRFNNNKILLSADIVDIGIWEYTVKTNTLERKLNTGYSFSSYKKTDEYNCLIGSSSTDGIYIYSLWAGSLGTITKVYNEGTWLRFIESNGKLFVSSNIESGILLYNPTNTSFTKIYNSGINWFGFYPVGNAFLITSTDKNSGLILYKDGEQTATKIYENGSWFKYPQIINNKCVLSSTGSNSTLNGVILYNSTTETVTQLVETGYYWILQAVGNKCLISSTSSNDKRILVYDDTTENVTQIYSNSNSWKNFQVINDKCLLSTDTSFYSGILMYNSENNTITKIYDTGYNYNKFTPDTGNNYFVESEDKTINNFIVYYDDTISTVKLVGFTAL